MNDISIYPDFEDFIKLIRDRMAYRIDKRLVNETPVDTSQARSNWIVSTSDTLSSTNVTSKIPKSLTINNGAAVIAAAPAFTDLYIINNVPYIVFLAEGSSKQNPTKYVDLIVESESRK